MNLKNNPLIKAVRLLLGAKEAVETIQELSPLEGVTKASSYSQRFFSDRIRSIYREQNRKDYAIKSPEVTLSPSSFYTLSALLKSSILDAALTRLSLYSHSSNDIVQLRSSLNEEYIRLRLEYLNQLEAYKALLTSGEYYQFKEHLASELTNIKRRFASLKGKLRSMLRMLSCANVSTDQRVLYRKKNRAIFKLIIEEDLVIQ